VAPGMEDTTGRPELKPSGGPEGPLGRTQSLAPQATSHCHSLDRTVQGRVREGEDSGTSQGLGGQAVDQAVGQASQLADSLAGVPVLGLEGGGGSRCGAPEGTQPFEPALRPRPSHGGGGKGERRGGGKEGGV